ncbi:hypothetical protein [Methanobrevibacter filiformis]|uniref:Uncharacterized protein n=1 Tax=Methanobrevibacter filiformis TaxID=55758 RepID=A0A166ADY8_9EURY|nr:hypothetical protein [Methanobrevibacter filiformis]KZX11912.1 hypothetical protein MBFIL_13030 [Methanobrevibacter filiformis]
MIKSYNRKSFGIVIALFVIVMVLIPLSAIVQYKVDSENIWKMTSIPYGSTVFEGENVIDNNKAIKFPVTTNIDYLFYKIKNLEILDTYKTVITGVVTVPINKVSALGISDSGEAQGFKGPGVLVFKDNKISVESPNALIWGKTVPYTTLTKTENGLKMIEKNKTVKIIAIDNINNNTVYHDVLSSEDIGNWSLKADTGDNLTIRYALDDFSDNRNLVSPDNIKLYFGESVYNYTNKHNLGTPTMVYMSNYSEEVLTESYSYLGSYPQYNDATRAFNANQFTKAWNGTIIPPNSTASGETMIGFAVSKDPHAPGGGASHGVCPPARSLRAAILSAGFPLPSGMNGDFEAVNFGVNPGSGIQITNSGNYPVKIIMWTEGSGTGTIIHTKLIKYSSNNQ